MSNDTRGPAASDTEASDSTRATTDGSVNRYLEDRVRELEAEDAHLHRSREIWRAAAEAARRDREWTSERIASLGRAFRIWLTLRGAFRRPRSFLRLPIDLFRAVTVPIDPLRIPTRPESTDGPAEGSTGRSAGDRSILERSRSNSIPRDPRSLRVAVIADERLLAGLGPECDLIEVRPDDWRIVLEAARPDMLLVESALRGNGGAWQYRIASYAHSLSFSLPDLTALTGWCRARGIPSVLWLTCDPAWTDRFLEAATRFDWVFTVDPRSVGTFADQPDRRASGIDVLPWAIQPRLHHPDLSLSPSESGPVLVGLGDAAWPVQRRDLLNRLIEATLPGGLTIYDPGVGAIERRDIPARVREARRIAPPVRLLPDLYRRHPVVVAGAVSTSVIPPVVLEALACGRPVLTTFHHGVETSFAGLVALAEEPQEIGRALEWALGHVVREHAEEDGLRRAVRAGTYRQRLAAIAGAVGMTVGAPDPAISALSIVDEADEADAVASALLEQERIPDEIVLGSSSWELVGRPLQGRLEAMLDGTRVSLVEQSALTPAEERLRRLAAASTSRWVTAVRAANRPDAGHIDRLVAWAMVERPDMAPGLIERRSVLDHDSPAKSPVA